MHRTSKFGSLIAAAAVLAVSLGFAPAVQAAEMSSPGKNTKPTVPAVSITAPASARMGEASTSTVTVTGLAKPSKVVIQWGDGNNSQAVTSCTVKQARKKLPRCTATVSHKYLADGQYSIVASYKGRVLGTQAITVTPPPQPWSPPEGWVQPAGWSMMGDRATYIPCSTVLWYYDPTNQPARAGAMKQDVMAGLGLLAAESNLVFTETANPAEATLTFGWDDISGKYGDAEAIGGGWNGTGKVVFSVNGDWVGDEWAGTGMVTREWDADGYHWTWVLPGRSWLVIHEVMHAMGLGHVDDPNQVMNPMSGPAAFGPGDLDGLHTMYKNVPCPA